MISDLIVALKPRMVTAGVTAPVLTGRRHLRQQGNAAPFSEDDGGGRIVVIPNKDKFGVGQTQGFNENPRHILTRKCGAEVHFWAVGAPSAEDQDLDAVAKVERLLHLFLRELHAMTTGHFQIEDSYWNEEPPAQTKDANLWGAEYVALIRVDVPITKKPEGLLPQGTAIRTRTSLGPNSPEQG